MILRMVKAKYRVSKDFGFLDHFLYIHGQLKYMKKKKNFKLWTKI